MSISRSAEKTPENFVGIGCGILAEREGEARRALDSALEPRATRRCLDRLVARYLASCLSRIEYPPRSVVESNNSIDEKSI